MESHNSKKVFKTFAPTIKKRWQLDDDSIKSGYNNVIGRDEVAIFVRDFGAGKEIVHKFMLWQFPEPCSPVTIEYHFTGNIITDAYSYKSFAEYLQLRLSRHNLDAILYNNGTSLMLYGNELQMMNALEIMLSIVICEEFSLEWYVSLDDDSADKDVPKKRGSSKYWSPGISRSILDFLDECGDLDDFD